MSCISLPQPVLARLPESLAKFARQRPLLFALGLVGTASGLWWAVTDYIHWRALGPSGLPLNLFGWFKATIITSLARRQSRITDTSDLDAVVKQIAEQEGEDAVFRRLSLLQRRGERPEVRGVIPQRQLDNIASQATIQELNKYIISLASDYPTMLRIAQSAWEGHVEGLFLRRGVPADPFSELLSERMFSRVAPRLEIAHVHSVDGSLHVSLAPADAVEIVRKGWGVRHRLAGRYKDLPGTYVMIYAPRDEEEVKVVKKIIAATVEYTSGLPKIVDGVE
ncbi:hypothetical protein BU17DRAFT_101433 [Hysterangium stoloniferum]|nr:hypothetical protein BU17DRAFT_101433 [Hysterangium stoloniferum]